MKLGVGMVATLTALVLGLLVSTAKNSFDLKNGEMTQLAVKLLVVDHALRQYGPEATPVRNVLREELASSVEKVQGGDSDGETTPGAAGPAARIYRVQAALLGLVPATDEQRALKAQAVATSAEMAALRWLLVEQEHSALPAPFLVLVVFWLAAIFTFFGLIAPNNGIVWMVVLVCALSFAGTLYVILEMDRPFSGLLRVSTAPLSDALDRMRR